MKLHTIGRHALVEGDCVEILRALPADSFDSCVTDPPYGLGFMGKAWDCDVPGVDFATELLRVLKPGAHACLFGGTRTFHRLAVALEDAGFEIRDCLSWLYGTGFPKSLDVSRAIDDKLGAVRVHPDVPATPEAAAWDGWGTAAKPAWEPCLLVRKPLIGTVAENVLTHGTGGLNIDATRIGTAKDVPASPAKDRTNIAKGAERGRSADTSGFDPNVGRWPANVVLDEEAAAVLDAQSGVSKSRAGNPRKGAPGRGRGMQKTGAASIDSTRTRSALETATSEARARRLDGIDPAVDWEPCLLVRKPLIGTVAENVLTHGTGGLNIDATRIETSDNLNGGAYSGSGERHGTSYTLGRKGGAEYVQPSGRWPANVVLDEEAAAVLDAQAGELTSGSRRDLPEVKGNTGGASRFFYVAKPSRAERDRGCDALPVRSGGEATDREDGAAGALHPRAGAGGRGGARNIHPTVKPAALIRWLVQLVTPPGGVVLDPFCGSGTIFLAAEGLDVTVNACERDPEYIQIAVARGLSAV